MARSSRGFRVRAAALKWIPAFAGMTSCGWKGTFWQTNNAYGLGLSGSRPTPTQSPASLALSMMQLVAGLFSFTKGMRVLSDASAATPGLISKERAPQSRAISAPCHDADVGPSCIDWPSSATTRNQAWSGAGLRHAISAKMATIDAQAAPNAIHARRLVLIQALDHIAGMTAMSSLAE